MKNKKGFTVIELMVIVAIIGILAAIAFPSYTEYVRKAKLAEVKASLLMSGTKLEKSNIANNVFPAAGTGAGEFNIADIENSDKYTFSYSRPDADKQSFYLTGKSTGAGVWAGINSSGTRCACLKCDADAITITAAATTCPNTTSAF